MTVRLVERLLRTQLLVTKRTVVGHAAIEDDGKNASLETDHDPPTDTFLALEASETDAVTVFACQTDLKGESIESMKMEIE